MTSVEAIQIQRLRKALQDFVDYQISDYDRTHNMARAYCAIRRRAAVVLGEIPVTDFASIKGKEHG